MVYAVTSHLEFDPSLQAYVRFGDESRAAIERSARAGFIAYQHPGRGAVYVSSRWVRGRAAPGDNPHQALPFFQEADPETQLRLIDLWLQYQGSWAVDGQEHATARGCEFFPFQRGGIDYALGVQHCLLADEPGLGKTVQALGVARETDPANMVVICPASIRDQWARMVARWWPEAGIPHRVFSAAGGLNPEARVNILSYNCASSKAMASALKAGRIGLLVLDEAHYLKDHRSQRTRAILGDWTGADGGVVGAADRVLALTGTPALNNAREIYPLARALAPKVVAGMSFEAFSARYSPTYTLKKDGNFITVTKPTGPLEELQNRLRAEFMVRRLKLDVLKDLPPVMHEVISVEDTGDIRKAVAAESMLLLATDSDLSRLIAPGNDLALKAAVAKVRREMGEAMVPRMVEHVQTLLDGGVQKLVFFGFHRAVLESISEGFGKQATDPYYGGLGEQQRAAIKDRFLADPECRVFIGQISSAGVGLDGLQRVASHCVFGEFSWSPEDTRQNIDRLWRIGQDNPVVAQLLVASGSLGERILQTALTKTIETHQVCNRKHDEN